MMEQRASSGIDKETKRGHCAVLNKYNAPSVCLVVVLAFN
jgi:hypothetical protein